VNMMPVAHQLGLEVEIWSKAPLFRLGKRKCGKREDFVETESYGLRFRFKNLGTAPFPSGHATIEVVWTSQQNVGWHVDIPKLNGGQEEYATFDTNLTEHQGEALSSGFGLFFCRAIHPSNTSLTSLDGKTRYFIGPNVNAVRSVKVITWNTIYAKWSMIVSAVGLFIVALDRIVAALFWILHR
jgi:hypothetical protein